MDALLERLHRSLRDLDHARHGQLAQERLAAQPDPDYGASIEISRDRDRDRDLWPEA